MAGKLLIVFCCLYFAGFLCVSMAAKIEQSSGEVIINNTNLFWRNRSFEFESSFKKVKSKNSSIFCLNGGFKQLLNSKIARNSTILCSNGKIELKSRLKSVIAENTTNFRGNGGFKLQSRPKLGKNTKFPWRNASRPFKSSLRKLNPTNLTFPCSNCLKVAEISVLRHKTPGSKLSSRLIPDLPQNTTISSRNGTLGFGSSLEKIIIRGNNTISSINGTFQLGFFTTNGGTNWYVGIWYAKIPIRTYVWVANREKPVKYLTAASVELTKNGRLKITDSSNVTVFETENEEQAVKLKLLETGNLVLLDQARKTIWQSFDFPADTWLPGMKITKQQKFTCWRSESDPSPGNYSLQLKSPGFGEFVLVWNNSQIYWTTGIWTGDSFSGVPEMTVPYIYTFRFVKAFTPDAYFIYTESSETNFSPLTRFSVDISGRLKQYTWSDQGKNWNMFWSRPENQCGVYRLCGNLGFCNNDAFKPKVCQCLAGFRPLDSPGWDSGDYSSGCIRESSFQCSDGDRFVEIGPVSFTGDTAASVFVSRKLCEQSCLKNCSCLGFNYNSETNECRNVFGNLLNLQNLSATPATEQQVLHFRVSSRSDQTGKNKKKTMILIVVCISFVTISSVLLLLAILRMKKKKKLFDKEEAIPVTNLRVFSYKELYTATRGFSEKLGHGGFGAVFRGELPPDSSPIAVKRLERPDSGEKEFRMEVCTIGTIQHVNLVRLRGFCSENPHRILVYDYMQNGSLAEFLRPNGRNLDWKTRFKIALGTARAIAYLHEECRDCIIHCDIKPENILLDGDFNAKISDFGLAKLVGRDFSRVLTTMRGTRGYLAPEWISGVPITVKADVYSYGMTLLEIIGGRRNVTVVAGEGEEGEREREWFFPPWAAGQIVSGNAAGIVDARLAGVYDSGEVTRASMVAVWCIQDEEGERPGMGRVVKMLEGTVAVEVPLAPKSLSALVADGESVHEGVFSSGVSCISSQVSVSVQGNGRLELPGSDSRD